MQTRAASTAATRTQIDRDTASRYLGQLRKHFAHKIPVSHDGRRGRIDFDFGRCKLDAGKEALTLPVRASSEESLGQTEEVIARHPKRFAFRRFALHLEVSSDAGPTQAFSMGETGRTP